MNNKLQSIAIIFLLCVVVILLALNLLRESPSTVVGGAEAPAVDPTLKPEDDPYIVNQVKNTIIKRSGTIQQCYNEFLERKPEKFEGRVKMDWKIEPDGGVSGAEKVTAEFGDEKFWNCMKSKISEWEFPDPPMGQQKYVAHKFFFKKNDEEAKKDGEGN